MSILMTILPSLSLLHKINDFIQKQEGKFSLNYGLFLLGWKSGLRVSEAVSFDYRTKHPRHKNLYLVKGKVNKKRYVYVSKEIIRELKINHWKPNQTTRFAFNNFLRKVKEKMNVPSNVELTSHTLRRCFATHNSLNGVPMPILQKALGHKNIKTTSCYWKGSVDIREFGGWLDPDSSPKGPEEVPKVKTDDDPQLPKILQIPLKLANPSPDNSKEPELLKTIEKLKGKLEQKDRQFLSFAETLNKVKLEKDQKLKELQEKVKQLTIKNNSLIENYANLKNTVKKPIKNPVKDNQIEAGPLKEKNIRKILSNSRENLSDALLKIKEPQNNSLAVKQKDQAKEELRAEIQVWKPPN